MVAIREGQPRHLEIPSFIQRVGTCITFPVNPDSSRNALSALLWKRGPVILHFLPTQEHQARQSVYINNNPQAIPTGDRPPTSNDHAFVQYVGEANALTPDDIPDDTPTPLKFYGDTVGILRHAFNTTFIQIEKSDMPVIVHLTALYTIYVDVNTPNGITRMEVKDYSGWKTENHRTPTPHCTVRRSTSQEEIRLDKYNASWSWMSMDAPICTVQFLTPPTGIPARTRP